MFSDFIKHYNSIRFILRDIFLYGCFSRDGLENKRSVSSRKVSYEIRRIQQYIQKEFIKFDKAGRFKLLSLTYDSITNTNNFLVNTYRCKSFTRTDLILNFYILLCLNVKDTSFCLKAIEEILIENGLISYDNISSKTLERKLNEMCDDLQILQCEKVGRTKFYSIAGDIFEELSNEELKTLYAVVSLYKNIQFPMTSGYYCEETLLDYMKYERNVEIKSKDYFQYKQLHFHPIIDEEILWQLTKAIEQKNLITFKYNSPKNNEAVNLSKPVMPYKIRYDLNCGRFYLVSFTSRLNCMVSRLDRIEEVKVENKKCTMESGELKSFKHEEDILKEHYDKYMKNSWSSVPAKSSSENETLIFDIILKEPNEVYIINKIKAELKEHKLTQLGDLHYRFETTVNNPREMVPWIRGYSGYIKIIASKQIAEQVKNDWKETLKNYGVIS